MLVLTDSHTSLVYAFVLPTWLGQNVVYSLFGHAAEQLLECARQAELPLHQVADKHHQVLAEALEHEEVSLHVVDVLCLTE